MNDNEIISLYDSGLNIREIAKKIQKSYEFTRQILKRKDVKFRKKYISNFTEEEIKEIIKKFDDGQTIKEIAKFYMISSPAISRLLKLNNKNPISSAKKYDTLRNIPINEIQKQLIVGTLLGDGCLCRDTSKSNFKLSLGHCEKQEQYFHWKVAILSPFVKNFRKNIDKRGNSVMLQTCTISHKEFNEFGEMFYDENRIKILPNNLDKFLTPLSLAIWIMDDGNLKSGVNMRIASMNFTEKENIQLQCYLKKIFDLDSKVMKCIFNNKKYYQITLNKENTQKLSDIIRPYVVDCMKYKIMPESSTTTCQTSNKKDDIV